MKIDTLCRDCGNVLFAEIQEAKNRVTVRVELCRFCMEEHAERNQEDDYQDGYDMGYSDGKLEGVDDYKQERRAIQARTCKTESKERDGG